MDEFFTLTKNDPGYVSDLRLRCATDAQEFFRWNVTSLVQNINDVEPFHEVDHVVLGLPRLRRRSDCSLHDFSATVDAAMSLGPDHVTQLLSCYVSCLGSWLDGVSIASAVSDRLEDLERTEAGATLLASAACVVAVAGQPTACRPLFTAALERYSFSFDLFFTWLRLATAELKRCKDHKRAEEALSRAEESVERFSVEGCSTHDESTAIALALNLRALMMLRKGNEDSAERLVHDAFARFEAVDPNKTCLPVAAVERYRTMVMENLALLEVSCGNWPRAISRFRGAVRQAELRDPHSQAEALSMLGYAELRAGDVASALETLTHAERLLREDISPPRLRSTRQLLAVASADADDILAARRWLQAADGGYEL